MWAFGVLKTEAQNVRGLTDPPEHVLFKYFCVPKEHSEDELGLSRPPARPRWRRNRWHHEAQSRGWLYRAGDGDRREAPWLCRVEEILGEGSFELGRKIKQSDGEDVSKF